MYSETIARRNTVVMPMVPSGNSFWNKDRAVYVTRHQTHEKQNRTARKLDSLHSGCFQCYIGAARHSPTSIDRCHANRN